MLAVTQVTVARLPMPPPLCHQISAATVQK